MSFNKFTRKTRKNVSQKPYAVIVYDKRTNIYIEKRFFNSSESAHEYADIYKNEKNLGAYVENYDY